jgi:hypothetical protein
LARLPYEYVPIICSALLFSLFTSVSPQPHVRVDLVFKGLPMEPRFEATAIQEVTAIWAAYDVDVRALRADEPGRTDAIRLLVLLADHPAPGLPQGVLGWIRFTDDRPEPAIVMYPTEVAALVGASAVMGNGDPAWSPLLRDVTVGRVFGRALAHEVGHYLLRSSHHSEWGLMRARPRASDLTGVDRHAFRLTATEVTRLECSLGTSFE